MVITVTLNPTVDRTLEVENFRVGEHAKARLKALTPGGKGINLSRGIALLGSRAAACAFVGHDEQGFFRETFANEAVQTHFLAVSGSTRTNTTVLDPVNHTTTHLREEGFRVGRRELAQMQELLLSLIEGEPGGGPAPSVAFCGALPRGVDPRDFALLVRSCASAGGSVIVDAGGEALRLAVDTGMVETIKPNLAELEQCLGAGIGKAEAAHRARELLDRVRTVLLTLGADGAYMVQSGMLKGCMCSVPECEMGNTVGCGDAFLAGWLHGMAASGSAEEALRWAVATGAACARSETALGYTREMVLDARRNCEDL